MATPAMVNTIVIMLLFLTTSKCSVKLRNQDHYSRKVHYRGSFWPFWHDRRIIFFFRFEFCFVHFFYSFISDMPKYIPIVVFLF